MQITLEIPQNRYAFFKALIRLLSFPKIVSVSNTAESEVSLVSKAEFFADLKDSFQELRLYKQGKIELQDARTSLEEVEREFAND